MATLEKIRSKGVLLLVIVGLALLAFIIGDFLNSGATYFNRSHENVAEIAGESIHITEYQAAIDQMMDVYKIETGQSELNEELTTQIRTSVWETMVNERILKAECEKIGLTVTAEELSDRIIGNNIHPIISQRRAFYDQNGRFSKQILLQFLNSLDTEAENREMETQIQQAKNYWLFWENTLRNSLLQEKYTALLSKSVTANSLDAKKSYDGRKTVVDVAYVMQPYYALPDSVVSVSNSEIKSLYAKKKEQYKQEPNRNLSYIAFDIVPSTADFESVEAWINKLKPEFETTNDIANVVNSNSDIPYDGRNFSETTVPAQYKEFAFSGKKGDVTAVMFENNTYSMARIMETGLMVSDSVKLRHIYLAENNQARVDSILAAIKKGADFAALARTYSVVEQTAANGGEIGWLPELGLNQEIAEPAFSKAAKETFTVAQGNGIQIFQIMEKSKATPKVKLAILSREVTPSSQTYSSLYNAAKQFIVENNTLSKFENAAKEQGLTITPSLALNKNTEKIGNLAQSRQIVRWAFNDKMDEGDVSDVFECGSCFVVAAIKEVNDGEYRSIENVAGELKAELIKDKKAGIMIKNMQDVLAQNNSLEAVAQAVKTDIQNAENLTFTTYRLGAAGMEPYVIGLAPALEVGKISAPVKGTNGVFVVLTSNKHEVEDTYDETSEIMQLNMRSSYSLPYMAIELLREKSDVEDNRSVFY